MLASGCPSHPPAFRQFRKYEEFTNTFVPPTHYFTNSTPSKVKAVIFGLARLTLHAALVLMTLLLSRGISTNFEAASQTKE